jgi:hypothetical protein
MSSSDQAASVTKRVQNRYHQRSSLEVTDQNFQSLDLRSVEHFCFRYVTLLPETRIYHGHCAGTFTVTTWARTYSRGDHSVTLTHHGV